jgi:hypothetical protein
VGWIPAVNTCVWKFFKIHPVQTWQHLASCWKDGREDSVVTLRGVVMRVVQRRHICYPLLNCATLLVCCFVKICKYMERTALTVCRCFLSLMYVYSFRVQSFFVILLAHKIRIWRLERVIRWRAKSSGVLRCIWHWVNSETAFEMWWYTRRNQISSFGETDESI